MAIFQPKIKKKDIALFLENLAFMLSCGYNAYDAVYWVVESTKVKKHDKEGARIRLLGNSLLKDLSEGYALSTSMERNQKYFEAYAKQLEAAEISDNVYQVLDQIVANIREDNELKHKIKSALYYPIIVLSITIGVAWYLFTYVIPDILEMLVDVGSGEVPPMTQMVMSIADWMGRYGLLSVALIVACIALIVFFAKGPFKRQFHRLYTKLPLAAKISLASNVCTWMQSMKYMLAAGSPMAQAMSSAADSMVNVYLRKQANDSYYLYATSGIPVADSLQSCSFLTAMELATINVGLESGQIVEVLTRLAKRRKDETEKAIQAFTTALNPAIICILGIIVGVIVMSVYGPLMNVTSILG